MTTTPMPCPAPRGPLSERVVSALTTGDALHRAPAPASEDDRQVTLWTLYELHHRGFADVDDDAEWRPDLLALRAELEHDLEERWWGRARALLDGTDGTDGNADLAEAFFALCEADTGPSVARFVQRDADVDDVLVVLRQKSVYHAKEQDAAMWTLPRLADEPKAHLMTLAYDEYGDGVPEDLHARLWAAGMRSVGLDDAYGAYVDEALPEVLEQNNLMAFLGLHRRTVPAALGHLAAFEVTSAVPSRRWVRGLERLGLPEPLVHYFREHMVADSVHEQVAVRQLLGSYLSGRPEHRADVFLGAAICLLAEGAGGAAVLDRLASSRADVA